MQRASRVNMDKNYPGFAKNICFPGLFIISCQRKREQKRQRKVSMSPLMAACGFTLQSALRNLEEISKQPTGQFTYHFHDSKVLGWATPVSIFKALKKCQSNPQTFFFINFQNAVFFPQFIKFYEIYITLIVADFYFKTKCFKIFWGFFLHKTELK